MRVFARRERPHPGAQLTLFETRDGWRYSLWVTNQPASVKGWRAQLACIDAAHRVHARVEDRIRTGKNCGIGHFPSQAMPINSAWLTAALTAATLLAWLQHLALDGDLARAEPKTIRPVNRTHCRSQNHRSATPGGLGVPGAPFGRSQGIHVELAAPESGHAASYHFPAFSLMPLVTSASFQPHGRWAALDVLISLVPGTEALVRRRYRVLHAAARLARGGRRRQLKILATWPWAAAIAAAWTRITALPQAP